MSDSKHSVRFPGESESYRIARDELLDAEIELRRNIEFVAAKRRSLPVGGKIPEDYCLKKQRSVMAQRERCECRNSSQTGKTH